MVGKQPSFFFFPFPANSPTLFQKSKDEGVGEGENGEI